MTKYKFINKSPNQKQKEEVKSYLLDSDFMRVLRMTSSYYIQGFHGDYGFIYTLKGGIPYIDITLY